LPNDEHGAGLSNLEYAPLCEIMGRSAMAPEVFNCSAPDTGNMEVLARYGTPEQQKRWLEPLLAGEIRSCFAMTEPDVASSDATTSSRVSCATVTTTSSTAVSGGLQERATRAARSQSSWGKTDTSAPRHKQQSMVLVPMDAAGVKIERLLTVYGYDHAPHGHAEVTYKNVRIPVRTCCWAKGADSKLRKGV